MASRQIDTIDIFPAFKRNRDSSIGLAPKICFIVFFPRYKFLRQLLRVGIFGYLSAGVEILEKSRGFPQNPSDPRRLASRLSLIL